MTRDAAPVSRVDEDPDPAAPPVPPARKPALIILRLVIVPAALISVFWLARREGVEFHPSDDWRPLAGALAAAQLAILLIGWRMHVGLSLFGIEIPWRQALRIGTQSQFYFFFLPLSAGNEIARYFKIKAIRPETRFHTLIVALVLDRLLGLLACVVIAAVALPLLAAAPKTTFRIDPTLAIGIAIGVLLVSTAAAWRLGWLRKLGEAWRESRGRRRLLIPASILVLLMQACTIASVYFAARWLGLDPGVSVLAFGISAGTLGQLIPVTFAGAGPAEVAGVAIFAALGVSTAEAGLLAALIYMTRLMAALEGGVWEIAHGWKSLRSAPGR